MESLGVWAGIMGKGTAHEAQDWVIIINITKFEGYTPDVRKKICEFETEKAELPQSVKGGRNIFRRDVVSY